MTWPLSANIKRVLWQDCWSLVLTFNKEQTLVTAGRMWLDIWRDFLITAGIKWCLLSYSSTGESLSPQWVNQWINKSLLSLFAAHFPLHDILLKVWIVSHLYQNHLELVLKMYILRLTPTESDSLGLMSRIRVLISSPKWYFCIS